MKEKVQTAGWQLDESAPEAYQRYLVPAIFESWTERLLDRVDLQTGDRVLDVACGTGIVARHAVSRVGEPGSVVGLDVNEGMLAVAKRVSTDEEFPIEWRQGDATDLPFADGSFDVVCCQQAIQFIDDPVSALEELRRVLASDGRVVVSVWRPLHYQPSYDVLAEILEHHIGPETGTMMRSPFPDWDADYIRSIARDAGFESLSITIQIGSGRYPSVDAFVRREAASSPLAEPIAAVDQERRDAVVTAVSNALEEYLDDDGIVFPMESFVLVGR